MIKAFGASAKLRCAVLLSALYSLTSVHGQAQSSDKASSLDRYASARTDGGEAIHPLSTWSPLNGVKNNAPNIVIVILDDIGFGDTSTFGGVARTPELDKLAEQGLRYVNFNNASICSPTRAALLSGRNQHRVGFGGTANIFGDSPGYDSVWRKNVVPVAEVLRRNGYSTAAFGKWHNTPEWEISPLGPFDRWPTGLGFEYFYGFMNPLGKESQWEPSTLYRNTTPVEPYATPTKGYHLTTDIVNEAIHWLQTHESIAAEKPYFLYVATGAVHEPHHVPKEWVDQYRGRFNEGWDRLRQEIFARQKRKGVIPQNTDLTPRPAEVPAWDSLSSEQKRLYARQMEVYAGYISHTDHEIGRLLRAIQESPASDNTLIFYLVGDNGSAPGGTNGFSDGLDDVAGQLKHVDEIGGPHVVVNTYSTGFAWTGSTPFQWWKTIASHFGGVRDPLIVSWRGHIKDPGGMRGQFTHVNDVAPTIYDATHIQLPSIVDGIKQQPLDGISFMRSFSDPNAPSLHHTQYFEAFGNRAIYHDGWVAAARHQWELGTDFAHDHWELYHVAEDFSEAHDLSLQYPDKLKELQGLFDSEASANNVSPLGGANYSITGDITDDAVPSWNRGKRLFEYTGVPQKIPFALMPPLWGRSFCLTVRIEALPKGAEGVIMSFGGHASGIALYMKDNQLVVENNVLNGTHELLVSEAPRSGHNMIVSYEFDAGVAGKKCQTSFAAIGEICSGIGQLSIDGRVVSKRPMTSVVISGWNPGSMGIGEALEAPVTEVFAPPFKFSGTLSSLQIRLQQ